MLEIDVRLVGPKPVLKLVPSDYLSGMLQQGGEHLEWLGLQTNLDPALPKFRLRQVGFEWAESYDLWSTTGCHRA
jgi:hypothetical protein